jgi:hypothetical protein
MKPSPKQTATTAASAPIFTAPAWSMVGIAGGVWASLSQAGDTSSVATVIPSPMPASQKTATTACCVVPTNCGWRWAANLERHISLHVSPRACGNGPINASGLRLSGARTKRTSLLYACTRIYSAEVNLRGSWVRDPNRYARSMMRIRNPPTGSKPRTLGPVRVLPLC